MAVEIRSSMLPGLARCRAMFKESLGKIAPGSDASREGTMWHAVKDPIIALRQPLGETDAALIAAAHGFTVDQVRFAADRLAFLADVPSDWEPVTEKRVVGVVPGTLDAAFISPNGERGQLFDIKSGRLFQDPAETNLQTINYALGMLDEWSTLQEIDVFVIYPRLMETSRATFTWERLEEFRLEIQRIVAEAKSGRPEYTIGTACEHCPAARTCPALNREVAQSILGPADIRESFAALPAEAKGRVLATAKAAIRLANEIVAAAKLHAPIDLGNGDVFQAVPTEERSIDATAGWPILTEWADTHLGEAVKIPLGAAKAAAVAHIEETFDGDPAFFRKVKGEIKVNKAAVERGLMRALDAAGAIRVTPGIEYKIIKGGLNNDNGNAGQRAIEGPGGGGAEVAV